MSKKDATDEGACCGCAFVLIVGCLVLAVCWKILKWGFT